MWSSLFDAIGQGFRFLTSFVRRSSQQESDWVDPNIAAQQRAATAAGAAADHASHIAGRPTK